MEGIGRVFGNRRGLSGLSVELGCGGVGRLEETAGLVWVLIDELEQRLSV